ncbi:MAG: di-heme oxidoredictase family protein [Pseudomonadota bacterium]
MKKNALGIILLLAGSLLTGYLWLTPSGKVPSREASENYPGGAGSVSIKPYASFMLPSKNLAFEAKPDFHAGKALAHQPWIKAPTTTDARDGLGPLFNARTCLACHVNGGRGLMPESDEQLLFHHVLRLSLPGENPVEGIIPEPVYGDQLQSQSTSLAHHLRDLTTPGNQPQSREVRPEAYVYIKWINSEYVFPDGEQISLRRPEIDLRQLAYGELHPKTLTSLRNAPPIHGMGLLQLIPQEDIDRLIDVEDRDSDGISGRTNISWDFETGEPVPGRFGYKANTANLRMQVAAALRNDMGIVSSIFPEQPCTGAQVACQTSIHGIDRDGLEISEPLLRLINNFTMSLAVPERRKPDHPLVLAGRTHFYQAGCSRCHQPSFKTGEDPDFPHLSGQTIWPYTDLLLHDMGPGLADGRSDYLASGSEWRTAPLWGVGLSQAVNGSRNLLHDGRARNVQEAILWHGGEAEAARVYFTNLTQEQRHALVSFVRSL